MPEQKKSLTLEELDEIEARLALGNVRPDDVTRLAQTVRMLLHKGTAEPAVEQKKTVRRAGEPAASKVERRPAPTPVEGKPVEIFTDGACQGNPGPGGWGVVLRSGSDARELSGYEPETTNNRMELTAVIRALDSLKGTREVSLCTDSQYVKKGITEWINTWKKNGWRTAARQPVKNADLWKTLDELNGRHQVTWRWVRGHSGHPENERCDELARRAIATRKR